MKSHLKIYTITFVLITCCLIIPTQSSAQQKNISFQVFYDQLSPYGQWIDYADKGYVWIPDTGDDFVPYSTNGNWILTNFGWTWSSSYVWGWAAFHYGRWGFDNSFGWFWVPDIDWGPAWVNWRQANGYFGWSPMEPGISTDMSFGREYDSRNDHWLFVKCINFEKNDISLYYVNQSDHEQIVRNSTTINRSYIDNERHTTYVIGPSEDAVEKATGTAVKPLTIHENTIPGQQINNDQFSIYRPLVEKNKSERKTAPVRITDMNEVKRIQKNDVTNNNLKVNINKVKKPVKQSRTIKQQIKKEQEKIVNRLQETKIR